MESAIVWEMIKVDIVKLIILLTETTISSKIFYMKIWDYFRVYYF